VINLLRGGQKRSRENSEKLDLEKTFMVQQNEVRVASSIESSTSNSSSTDLVKSSKTKNSTSKRKLPEPARSIGGRRFSRSSSSSSNRKPSKELSKANLIQDSQLEKSGMMDLNVEVNEKMESSLEAETGPSSESTHGNESQDSEIDEGFLKTSPQLLFANQSLVEDRSREELESVAGEQDHDGDDEMEPDSTFTATPKAMSKFHNSEASKTVAFQSPISPRKKVKNQVLNHQPSESSIVILPETPKKGINGNLASNRSRHSSNRNVKDRVASSDQVSKANRSVDFDTTMGFEISHEFSSFEDSLSVSESESEGDAVVPAEGAEKRNQDPDLLNSTPLLTRPHFGGLTGRSPALVTRERNPQDVTWRNSGSLGATSTSSDLGADERKNPDVPSSVHDYNTGVSDYESVGTGEGGRKGSGVIERRGSSFSWRSGSSSLRAFQEESIEDGDDFGLESWDGRSTTSSSISRACSPSLSFNSSPIKARRNSVSLQTFALKNDSSIKKKNNSKQRPKSVSQASTSSFPFTLTLSTGSKTTSAAKISTLKGRKKQNLSSLFKPLDTPDRNLREEIEEVDMEELERLSRLAESSWENFNSTVKLGDENPEPQASNDRIALVSSVSHSASTTSAWNEQRRSRSVAMGMSFMPSCDFSLDGAMMNLAGPSSQIFKRKAVEQKGSSSSLPPQPIPALKEAPKQETTLSFVKPEVSMGSPGGDNEKWVEDWGNSPLGLSLDTRGDSVGTPTKFEDLVGQFQKRTASEQKRLKKWGSGETLGNYPSPSTSRRSSGLSRPATSPLLFSNSKTNSFGRPTSPRSIEEASVFASSDMLRAQSQPKSQLSSPPTSPPLLNSSPGIGEDRKTVRTKISLADFLDGLNAPIDPSFPPGRPSAQSPKKSRSSTAPQSTTQSPRDGSFPTFSSPSSQSGPIGLGLISPTVNPFKFPDQRCTSPSPLRMSLGDDSIPKEASRPRFSFPGNGRGRTPRSHPLPHRARFSPDLDPPRDTGISSIASSRQNSVTLPKDYFVRSPDISTDFSRNTVELEEWKTFALSRLGASLSNGPLENQGADNSIDLDLLSPSASSNFSPVSSSFANHYRGSNTLFHQATIEEDEDSLADSNSKTSSWKPKWREPSPTGLSEGGDSPCASPALVRSRKISSERERTRSSNGISSAPSSNPGSRLLTRDFKVIDESKEEVEPSLLFPSTLDLNSFNQRSLSSQVRSARHATGEGSYGGAGVWNREEGEESNDGMEWDSREEPTSFSNFEEYRASLDSQLEDEGLSAFDGGQANGDSSNALSSSMSMSSDFDICQHLLQKARWAKWEKQQERGNELEGIIN